MMSPSAASSRHLRLVEPAPPGAPKRPVQEPLQIEAVFHSHVRYVAAIALRLLGDDEETDDLIQDVFVAAAESLPRLRDREALSGWLASITVRLAMRRLRRRRLLRMFTSSGEEEVNAVAAHSGDPEDRTFIQEVYTALEQVPTAERVAWILHHLEGETLARVAMLCNCSLATAKRRIAIAHHTVRKLVPNG